MLSESGVVKLSDFGFKNRYYSRYVDGWSIYDALLYQAPEVFVSFARSKSDVWSLGMNVIEMTEGRNPYDGMTSREFKNELLNKSPPSLSSSGWSDDLVDFVKKCLMKDVNERASVEVLLKVSVVVMG